MNDRNEPNLKNESSFGPPDSVVSPSDRSETAPSLPNPWSDLSPMEPPVVVPTQQFRSTYRPIYFSTNSNVQPLSIESALNHPVDLVRLVFAAFYSRSAQEKLFPKPLDKVFAVPRRFDLATLFTVSTVFSILFGVTGQVHMRPYDTLLLWLYICTVGFCQASLFGGRAPRAASAISGSLFISIAILQLSRGISPGEHFVLFFFNLSWGSVVGYFTGTLIGGVFLVADRLRNYLQRRNERKKNAGSGDLLPAEL